MQFDDFIAKLRSLKDNWESEEFFWAEFLACLTDFSRSRVGFLVGRVADKETGILASFPAAAASETTPDDLALYARISAEAVKKQGVFLKLSGSRGSRLGGAVYAVRLPMVDGRDDLVAVLRGDTENAARAGKVLPVLRMAAHVPGDTFSAQKARETQTSLESISQVFELLPLFQQAEHFQATVMALCNELAARFACSRVTLGWMKGKYARVQAISHVEKFEPRMNVVRELEAVMEESGDQDRDILFTPGHEGDNIVSRAHEQFTRQNGLSSLMTVSLKDDQDLLGFIVCERSDVPFSTRDVRKLRAVCDFASPTLSKLFSGDLWFGARLSRWLGRARVKVFGFEHSLLKAGILALCIGVGVIMFSRWDYRVEAPCLLRTDTLGYLTAPFNGYVESMDVEVGDNVSRGDLLLDLDTRELLLEEASVLAEYNRNLRSMEKARAQNALADMKISQARIDQSRAELERIQYFLSRARMIAPFDGIVVEGDRKKLLGSPVQKGDLMFKLARIDELFVDLDVEEQDIHEISVGMGGEIAFLSRPDIKFPIRVERISPVARVKEGEGNVFVVRAVFTTDPAAWWRPGISGVGKLDVGRRSLAWILTHRTMDFLRIYFWW